MVGIDQEYRRGIGLKGILLSVNKVECVIYFSSFGILLVVKDF